jgi:hypothetical protein
MIRPLLFRLRAPAATGDAREPASPRILPTTRAGWRQARAALARLNDSAWGDFFATICFCATALIAAICFLAP